ncbi:hypothetical protein ACOJQI_15955 [Bacillus salacetis]
MKDKKKAFLNSLLANSEKVGMPKKVIEIYINQINNRFEVK